MAGKKSAHSTRTPPSDKLSFPERESGLETGIPTLPKIAMVFNHFIEQLLK